MHELRPWISSYIDQWLHQFPLDASHSVIAREEQRPKKADASGSASSSSELCIPLTPSKPYIAEFESAAESEIVMMLRDEHRNFLDKITSLIAQSASMTYHHFQESFGQLPTPSSAPETPLTLVSSPGSSSTESDRAQETPLTDYDEMSPEPFCSSEKQLSRPKLPPTLRRLAENEKSPSPKPRMKIPSPSTSDDEFYSPEQGYSPLSFKIVQVDAKGEEEMPMTPDGRETPKTQSRLAAPICNLPQADKSAQKRPRILFPDLSDFDKNENQRRHSDILHTPGTAELSLSSSKEEDFYRRSKSTSDISRNSENRPRSVSQSRV